MQKRGERLRPPRLPHGQVLLGVVGGDELEELHQRPLGPCRDGPVGEDVLAAAGDPAQLRGWGRGGGGGGIPLFHLVDIKRSDGDELDLAEGPGRDELLQQPGAAVDDLGREG